MVLAAPTPIPLTGDAATRTQWIDATLETIKQRHMDGVVFDFEDPLPAVANGQWAPQAAAYVALINETTRRFHDGTCRLGQWITTSLFWLCEKRPVQHFLIRCCCMLVGVQSCRARRCRCASRGAPTRSTGATMTTSA